MNDVISIRPATAADFPGWLTCATGLFAEDGGTRDPGMDLDWPATHGAEAFHGGLDDADRLILVAVAAQEVVGTVNAVVAQASAARPIRLATLRSLYVKPPWRSAGVGARLVAGFRDWARANGAQRVAVTAYAANTAALRFYQRQGLEPFHVTLEADA